MADPRIVSMSVTFVPDSAQDMQIHLRLQRMVKVPALMLMLRDKGVEIEELPEAGKNGISPFERISSHWRFTGRPAMIELIAQAISNRD